MPSLERSINSKRGQAFLRELILALNALPEKILIYGDFENSDGYCVMGACLKYRNLNVREIDDSNEGLGSIFNIHTEFIEKVIDVNDSPRIIETQTKRWHRVRDWAVSNLKTKEKI